MLETIKKHVNDILLSLLVLGLTVYIALDSFVLERGEVQAEEIKTVDTSELTPLSEQESETENKPEFKAPGRPSPVPGKNEKPHKPTAAPTEAPSEDGEEDIPEPTEAEEPEVTDEVVSENAAESTTEVPPEDDSTEGIIHEYSDDYLRISISRLRYADTTVYIADITAASPAFLKTAFAKGLYGKNVTAYTSKTAAENGAILAINGDYYGVREAGYVIRNGVLYRNVPEAGSLDLAIMADGSFRFISEDETTAEQLVEDGAYQVFSFGPPLLSQGVNLTYPGQDIAGKHMSSNPRTAIGRIDNNHYIFLVSDGRTDESKGISLYDIANIMLERGVQDAYNLDGGGSSAMVFQGTVVNKPTGGGGYIGERSVSDIVFIGY